ncbi:MAG: hypothetical protein QOF30_276 [Acidimicrobiaceae bacterium]|nr:hypothetical protein [Acidimicrobiaceae bacterium]
MTLSLLVSACSGATKARATSAPLRPGFPAGHSLDDKNVQNGSTFQLNGTDIGQTYRFSFPIFKNTSKSPIIVTSVRLVHVPADVQVLGYPEFTITSDSGYPLDQRFDFPGSAPEPLSFSGPIVVAPGERSPHFFMVAVRLRQATRETMRGCAVAYTQRDTQFEQQMSCQFALTP